MFGEARREYVVDKEPVMGVRVSVNVYGNVDIGVGGLDEDEGEGVTVAAGRVLNRSPVDIPMREEIGE